MSGGRTYWVHHTAFWLTWVLLGGLLRLYFRIRVHNHPSLAGGFVLVANHSSFLDPLVLGAACRRRSTFIMNAVTYRNPRLQWFYRLMRSIPVSANGDNRGALRAARQILQDGAVLVIFPEGGISRDGQPMLGSPGAVSLVMASGLPVIPVGMSGVNQALPHGASLPRPKAVQLRFGDPIAAADLMVGEDRKARLAHATQRLMREIAELSGQQSRADQLAQQRTS